MGEIAKRRIVTWSIRAGILFVLIGLVFFFRDFIPVNYSLFSDSEAIPYYKVVAVERGSSIFNWQWLFLLGILFIVVGLVLRRIFKN